MNSVKSHPLIDLPNNRPFTPLYTGGITVIMAEILPFDIDFCSGEVSSTSWLAARHAAMLHSLRGSDAGHMPTFVPRH